MTDYERTQAFLASLDIPFQLDSDYRMEGPIIKVVSVHTILATPSPKVDGYGGFLADWYFDADGKFIKMGIWES